MQLSIIIPARNEMFLARTVQDILENKEAKTEIIAVLDGAWANPPIPQHPDVNVIFLPEPIGQRAAQNTGVRLSRSKFVCKVDAHCSFDKGFDRKMIEAFKQTGDDVTMVPVMRNLHAFDWKCYNCGWKTYQGPTPIKCGWIRDKKGKWFDSGKGCGKDNKIRRKMLWIGKHNPQSTSYCFDSTPHFNYFEDYKHRPEYIKDKAEKGLTETMSLQGSCWMSTRENYWKWELCDEALGNWGGQGIEVACATWLTGGRVLVNTVSWYAHMFRTQGGDFSFPWRGIMGQSTDQTKMNVKNKYWNMEHPKQIHPVSWLIEKFWPVPGWSEEDLRQLKEHEKTLNKN